MTDPINTTNIVVRGPQAHRIAVDVQAALCGKYTVSLGDETYGPTYSQGEVVVEVRATDKEFWPDGLEVAG